jgi:predicted dinucleotide-utilizing enzyme
MLEHPELFSVVWVYNRSPQKLEGLPSTLPLLSLGDHASRPGDLIVEVAHPTITAEFGASFMAHSHLFLGSPTACASPGTYALLREGSVGRALFVPSGALWGAGDIAKMGRAGSLARLCVTMKKHPASLLLEGGEPKAKLEEAVSKGVLGETTLYSGPLRQLALVAPNNVNTMAAAAIASGEALGFDGVWAILISDPSLTAHVVEVEVEGHPGADGQMFSCKTVRYNPAAPGAVTGTATYASFFASLMVAAKQVMGSRSAPLQGIQMV